MKDSEPDDIKEIFQSSQRNCSYRRGSFDPNLIKTVSLGTDNCIGDLKDTLDDLKSTLS
jgi:ABC-type Zn2+ transport system substrate-binding protein/surface adhesin